MKLNVFLALLLLVVMGCGKSNYRGVSEVAILRILPKMSPAGKLQDGEYTVIQSQEELLRVYPDAKGNMVKELKEIDFSTQTLLLGRESYSNEADLSYRFYKEGDNYTLVVKITGLATRPDAFEYGVIVEKLPKNAKVMFKVNKL